MLLIGLTGSIATGKSTVASILAAPPYNLPIIDADLLARQVVAPGTRGYAEIVEYFGKTLGMEDLFLESVPEVEGRGKDVVSASQKANANATLATSSTSSINDKNGKQHSPSLRPLNRAALGRRVFGPSPSAQRDRKVLNRITHPRVRLAMLRLILYYYIMGHWAVVLDIPLLFESGLDIFCGGVIMVAVRDPEVQMRRLLDRDRGKGLGRKEAENRVLSQGRVEDKVGRTRERGVGRGVVVWNDEGLGELRGEVERAVVEIAGYMGGRKREENGEEEGEGEEKLTRRSREEGTTPITTLAPSPPQYPRIPPHPNRYWTWWLWASPWLAVLVAAAEVLRGWKARRRWELRQKREKQQAKEI